MPSRRVTIPALVLLALCILAFLSFRLGNPSARLLPHSPPSSPSSPDFWTWETVSRFRPSPSAASSEPDICDSFPSEILPRVQVVLKIGASEPADRIEAQFATATRCISNLIIVSDHEQELKSHHVHDIIATLPHSYRVDNTVDFEAYEAFYVNHTIKSNATNTNTEKQMTGAKGWKLDRFKFLPMVEYAYEVNPTANWFVFIESDTYVVWDNLFRLLDSYNHHTPLYFGSPSPGRKNKDDETTWFAYGGAGFVLSSAAVQKAVVRKAGANGEFASPSLTEEYQQLAREDCCGDSILGWVLYQKGIKLSGLWPMFNPHPLHGIPFDDKHWCQPVITLHKTLYSDMESLSKYEQQRGQKQPLLYADLIDYHKIGTFEQKTDWDNGDWGGWQEPLESPGHASMAACKAACHDHPECLEYTYDSSGHCVFVRTVRLGGPKTDLPDGNRLSAGWDLEKIANWRNGRQCEKPLWVKPSITRIF
ncbi:hypothetical protein ASPWEDRAFT_39284 [Aspergillus wentii DTO 134E9]|uniref:N-acetylgalactosaminide beta-1,3-galactosyltransferase n=1 Tax=Aspergillus wentii DTO 134E9 TaxID=1073089 RepID=A0A1L9RRG3_ASPWE|nr:uncharacterized protein ASPWEDRAFT_39284 [Aspergillus wentii DTO 134E9]OJJ37566.1 hypothetical protein ASPWEDRAFT_39284 [Aspergillus wentii DTO 134E9]